MVEPSGGKARHRKGYTGKKIPGSTNLGQQIRVLDHQPNQAKWIVQDDEAYYTDSQYRHLCAKDLAMAGQPQQPKKCGRSQIQIFSAGIRLQRRMQSEVEVIRYRI